MLRRTPQWPLRNVCFECRRAFLTQQRHITSSSHPRSPMRHSFASLRKSPTNNLNGSAELTSHLSHDASSLIRAPSRLRRAYHTTSPSYNSLQPTATPVEHHVDSPFQIPIPRDIPVREHLRRWQEEFGQPNQEDLAEAFARHPARQFVNNEQYLKLPTLESRKAAEDTAVKDQGDPDLDTLAFFLQPGDVAEIRTRHHEPTLAVFVQQLNRVAQFILPNGKWHHANLTAVLFAIPSVVNPKLIEPIIPYLPTKADVGDIELHVPLELTRSVTTPLQRLVLDADRMYREYSSVIDNAHSALAGGKKVRMMTLTQIAAALLSKGDPKWEPSPAILLAVRKGILHNPLYFQGDGRSSRSANIVTIRPKEEVQLVEIVHNWMREYTELRARAAISHSSPKPKTPGAAHVVNFITKARRIISASRKLRDHIEGGQLSSKAQSSSIRMEYGEEFSESDKLLINFIKSWVLTDSFRDTTGLWSQCATLIKATECYNEYVTLRSTGLLFLQEIGVALPWENRQLYDSRLMLPITEAYGTLEGLQKKTEALRLNPGFHDSMQHLRHDWGETTVYCIDDAEAQEIDDGISIAKVPDQENEYWVHVHVANPTAFFDQTNPLSSFAADMTETFYGPEIIVPMMPRWVTQDHFSLRKGRPVLTFSIRLDSSGFILETKIQNGVIHNVVSLTPQDISEALGTPQKVKRTRIVVGGDIPQAANDPAQPKKKLSPIQTKELQDLCLLAVNRRQLREKAGGVSMVTRSANIRLFENGQSKPGLAWRRPSEHNARLVHGDPIIEFTAIQRETSFEKEADETKIVSEMMMLACEAAGRWCAERDIPAIFRGTIQPPNSHLPITIAQFQKEILDPYVEEHGPMPLGLSMQYHGVFGRGIAHLKPHRHHIMGLDHYVKVTSPLRRFGDMIAHWQIEAALRWEAETGKKFNQGCLELDILPFSEADMRELAVTLVTKEAIIARARVGCLQFWLTQAILRGSLCKETELPETYHAVVTSTDFTPVTAHLVELDSSVFLNLSPDVEIEVGDEWEVNISEIRPFERALIMDPIRLVRRNRMEEAYRSNPLRKAEKESGGVGN